VPTQSDTSLIPRLTVRDCATGVTDCIATTALSWQRFEYDGLGRMKKEKIRIPAEIDVIVKTRTSAYNPLGWKTSESVWGSTSLKTTYSYDHLGRVLTIQPPGSNPATTFAYGGERVKTRATQVMLEVHTKGKGVCGVYNFEIAETKVAQVMGIAKQHQHPLLCTMEES